MVYIVVVVPSQLKRFQNLLLFAGEIIYKDNYEIRKHREISDKSAAHLMSSSIKVLVVVSIGLFCFLMFPLYAYLFMNQRPMIVPIVLPFVDENTDSGYYINIAHQLVSGVVGVTAVIAIELMNCIFKNNIYAAKESIIYSLDELGTMLRENTTFSMQMQMEFRNVLIKIQDLDRFLIELCDIYYWKFFLQPIFLAYGVSASLLCYYVVSGNSNDSTFTRAKIPIFRATGLVVPALPFYVTRKYSSCVISETRLGMR